jgi:hypothetical protein
MEDLQAPSSSCSSSCSSSSSSLFATSKRNKVKGPEDEEGRGEGASVSSSYFLVAELPSEILLLIFSYLEVTDLLQLSLVCKRCKSAFFPLLVSSLSSFLHPLVRFLLKFPSHSHFPSLLLTLFSSKGVKLQEKKHYGENSFSSPTKDLPRR